MVFKWFPIRDLTRPLIDESSYGETEENVLAPSLPLQWVDGMASSRQNPSAAGHVSVEQEKKELSHPTSKPIDDNPVRQLMMIDHGYITSCFLHSTHLVHHHHYHHGEGGWGTVGG